MTVVTVLEVEKTKELPILKIDEKVAKVEKQFHFVDVELDNGVNDDRKNAQNSEKVNPDSKIDLIQAFFHGGINGAMTNMGMLFLALVLTALIHGLFSFIGSFFKEETAWLTNQLPDPRKHSTQKGLFISIMALQVCGTICIYIFGFCASILKLRNMIASPIKKNAQQLGFIVVYSLMWMIQFPFTIEFLLKMNPDLTNSHIPTLTDTRRFILDVFFWIPMEAAILCLIVWIWVRVFAVCRCFKKTKKNLAVREIKLEV